MGAIFPDLEYALRVLRKSPGVALAAIGTLALGMGATTAMFSVVDGVLLAPLPVADQARVIVAWTSLPERGFAHWPLSYASFEGIRERLRTVSGVAAQPYAGALPAVLRLDDGTAMPLQRASITGNWFDVLGVRPYAGRVLATSDDRIGAPDVLVLSAAAARRLFGGAGQALGRRLRFEDTTWTVVGVAPPELDYPRGTDAWIPAARSRHSPYMAWDLVARVAPGFTIAQTRADLTSALASLPPEADPLGKVGKDQIVHVHALADDIVGEVRPALLLTAGAVLLMLIVAGANVATLLTANGLARGRELSVRAAIGASRIRLVRQLSTEAALLALCGGIAAMPVALAALQALLALAPAELPRASHIRIDGRAVAFTAGIGLLVAVVFGVLPAIQITRVQPADALRTPDGAASPYGRRYWLRRALVAGQIAVTMIVVSVAALLSRSLDGLQRVNLGFDPDGVFLAELSIPPGRYSEPADHQRAMIRLAEYVAGLPGVSHATALTMAPFAGTQGVDAMVFAEGQALEESANPLVNYEGVDASYFATMRVHLRGGRPIGPHDGPGSRPVAVVNDAFARLFWPGRESIGRRVKWGSSSSDSPWLTVVGVVDDTRYREFTSVRPTMYVPYAHGIPVTPAYVAARGGSPALVAGSIRQVVASLEPGAAVVRVDPLRQLLAAPLARPRFQTTLVVSFATAAVLLSAIGTYGMLSFLVRHRRREIGIRIAIGAAPRNVRGLVLQDGLTAGAIGVALGAACVLAAGRLVQPFLFGVTPADPVMLAAAAAALLSAVLAATLLPTRAATRTDPLLVLRGD